MLRIISAALNKLHHPFFESTHPPRLYNHTSRELHCRSDILPLMAILVFEHSPIVGIGRLGTTLRDYGHRLHIVRRHLGDPIPADLDDVDGIISCGGPQSANDDSLPWLEPEMQLIRQAHELEMPVVGLCLGAQIIARALGGEVSPMNDGPEVGWHEVRLTPVGREDPIHAGIAWWSIQPHFHYDCVSELPPGARLLASSDQCKVQVWASGLRTYGFQFHVEIQASDMLALADNDPDALAKARLSREELTSQAQKNYAAFERLTNRLFDNIALLLMPVDRRYQGLVKDLHH